ncbi:MAG: type IV toxin-antitoxin system AbiEi family antitoxin [Thermoplasmatales archaeon]|nr:type IV toxin-antitoxin system AbiEi family antitoxin [Thermoplasmatales archaeon]
MGKNIYLTKSEQNVFNWISKTDIITNKEIKELLPNFDEKNINKICYKLMKKKYLRMLKKGLYLVQKEGKFAIENPFKIALFIYHGYIGFSSALRFYGLIEYEPFTIFVVTKHHSKNIPVGQYSFKYVAMGERAVGITYSEDIFVSTIEKTFFDCFYKPQYAGGYSTITKALKQQRKMNWDRFLYFFKNFSSNSLCQRTGYILDILRETDFSFPQKLLRYLENRIKTNTKLLPTAPSQGEFIKKWKLIDNVGKENILSWWYHG